MQKYLLIEKEALGQVENLPVVYKTLQYGENKAIHQSIEASNINVNSIRHQTKNFIALRFYKNIEIFKL